MKKTPFYRRKFFINNAFQLPFIARIVVINLLMMALLFVGLYLIFYRFNFLGNELGFESGHRFYEFVREQFVLIAALFLGAAISSTIVLAVYSVFLSHRIAGPLENLKIRFKKMRQELPQNCKTRFRKDDFFHDLADAYNEHLDAIQKDHQEESSGSEEAPAENDQAAKP